MATGARLRYRHVRICGPAEARPLLTKVFEGAADVKVHNTQRRSRLHFEAQPIVDLRGFLATTRNEGRFVALVAFSRAAVLSLAAAAQKAGARASVVFGKLPPEARRAQLDAARAGRLDVLVCTDVIGHGINLPLDDVVFAETRKFDGQVKRDLYVWEAAQVAGRAGRGDRPGRCWHVGKYGANKTLLRDAVAMANGDPVEADTGLELSRAVLAPDLGALRQLLPREPSVLLLPRALAQWRLELEAEIEEGAASLPAWVRGGDLSELV